MSRFRVVSLCWLALLIPWLVCSAQSPPGNPSSALTSVHELQIPPKARAACHKGTERFAAKDSAGSISEFQKAIQAFPDYYEAYAKLGAAQLDLERWDAAESAFRKSLELSGGRYAPANFGLGVVLATVSRKFSEAEALVRSGLETSPADASGHFVLAWILYSTDRLQGAEKSALQAIALGPAAAGTRLLLAQIHLRENRFSAVVEDLDAYRALGIHGPMDEKVRLVRSQALRALAKTEGPSEVAGAGR
jgi:tetratricopeptide (TPR) repeat protein